MKILTLTYEFPPVGGGGGQAAEDICRGLIANGHEVEIITSHWGELAKEETIDGMRVFRVEARRKEAFRAPMGTMMTYVLSSIPKAIRRIRAWKPDVIHVHFAVPTGAAAWAVSVLTGMPYVITAHLGDVPGGVPQKTGRWFRYVYPLTPPIWKRAARVAAVSAFTRGIAQKHYDVPIDVIYNGVDLKAIDPGEIKVNQPPRIIFAGRFMAQKNPLLLVQTLGKLKDLDWRCSLVGDGPLREDVEAEIERLGIADRFTLPGWVTPDEVLAWYRQSDVLFMPSRSEGLPVVGVQAVAMGLAPVMSRVGGCVDIIDHGVNGYLIESDDAAGFEEALRGLLSDTGKLQAFRLASRELAKKFDLNTVVDSYIHLFESAIEGWDANRWHNK